MNDIKRQLNEMIEQIHVKKESSEVKSHSSSSLASSASLATSKTRAKAESEKIKLQFLKKEAEIKKEHFQKSIELELLQQEEMVAAADAEASYLEKQLIDDGENREHMALPKEEITPFNKTMNYLEGLVSPSKPEPHALSTQATASDQQHIQQMPMLRPLLQNFNAKLLSVNHPHKYIRNLQHSWIPT